MALLEEFRSLLISFGSDNRSPFSSDEEEVEKDDGVKNGDSVAGIRESSELVELRSLARRSMDAGLLKRCVHVYINVRKAAVETRFQKLGIEEVENIGHVFNGEDVILTKSKRLIKATKFCIRVLFANEKRLYEQIFVDASVDETCFVEIVKDSAIQLFKIVELVSASKRSPAKLFTFLDLYQTITDLLPDVEKMFKSKTGDASWLETVHLLPGLADAARESFSRFEDGILPVSSGFNLSGGLHPATKYVMDYIRVVSDNYKKMMIELITWNPSTGSLLLSDVTNMGFPEIEGKGPLALHIMWILVMLQFDLEGISVSCKDTSLAHLFMMNNQHYMVQKIEDSQELREMVGEYYMRKLMDRCWRASMNYHRTTWVKILSCLHVDGIPSTTAVRERIKEFNAMFAKVHKTQATWVVQDAQLREELRISITDKLCPAYRSFLGRFRSHVGRRPENYIKYSPEDLEKAIFDLFEGHPVRM